MRSVYKYKLQMGSQNIELPYKSSILSAAEQNGEIYMWVIINPDSVLKETREICVYGTGWDIEEGNRDPNENLDFIDTVVMNNGLVFHVFENRQ